MAPHVPSMPYRNKGSGEESPVELTPTPEKRLLGAHLEGKKITGKPDEVSLTTSTSSLVKMTQLYPTHP